MESVVADGYRWFMTVTPVAEITRPTRLDPFCQDTPRFLGVTDTDALLSSIDNDCRKGWHSRLLRMSSSGTAFLYASDHVYFEVYRRLPKIARSSPVPLDTLRAHFETEYLPALRFVTVSDLDAMDSQVLAINDSTDVPTGRLAKLIAPSVVFSGDKHLRNPGLAPKDWQAAARLAIDISEGDSGQRSTAVAASLPVYGTVQLTKFVGGKIGVSPWILGAVLIGGGYLLLRKPERREKVLKYAIPAFEFIATEFEEAAAQERRGVQGLAKIILPEPAEPSIRQQVAITLARQGEPLLAKEIQELIQGSFSDDLVPTVAEVRTVLTEGSEFVQPERYRWQFGRETAPWEGTLPLD